MNREERLFDAIGGADASLLERSERRRRRTPWLGWGIGLAACLAAVVIVRAVLPGTGDNPPPDTANDVPPITAPTQEDLETPTDPDNPGTSCTLPYEPWPAAEGEWHYLAVRAAQEAEEPRFRVYINKEIYYSYEQEGVYIIRPYQEPDSTPECRLKISHMAGVTVDEALEQVQASLTGLYETVEAVPGPPNGGFEVIDTERYLFASNGTAWDAAQREVWIRPDGEGGVFVLSSSYFMEATEGHGARFMDMMMTVMPAYNDPDYPEMWHQWETDLLDAGERLAEAVFADDLDRVSDLLTGDAEVYGYGEDVSGCVSVASIDYSTDRDNMLDGGSVTVSVKHRMGGEDSYTFLTMEMTYQDGQWRAYWIGLEK